MNKAHPDCVPLNYYFNTSLTKQAINFTQHKDANFFFFRYLNLELDAGLDFSGTLKENKEGPAQAASVMPTVA